MKKPQYIDSTYFEELKNTDIIRPIYGYDGHYYASREGYIISANYLRSGNPAVLSSETGTKYHRLFLSKDGKTTPYPVHRLIAITFIPNPENLPCVNHKNENKLDNRAENLEWCTYKYNSAYGTARQRAELSKMKDRQAVVQKDLHGNIINIYGSLIYACNDKLSKAGIHNCCKGYTPHYKGYIWEFCTIEDKGSIINCSLNSK